MAYQFKGLTIEKIGIIGSGQIGPDIALHFTKVMQPFDVPIVVVDIAQEALDAGQAKLQKKVAKGVKTGAFKPEQGEASHCGDHSDSFSIGLGFLCEPTHSTCSLILKIRNTPYVAI